MARPKKPPEERRENFLGMRFTARERAALDTAAAAHGLTLGAFIRHRALGRPLPPSVVARQEQSAAATALIRLGAELNRIAHDMNAGRPASIDSLTVLMARIEAEIDRLCGPSADDENTG